MEMAVHSIGRMVNCAAVPIGWVVGYIRMHLLYLRRALHIISLCLFTWSFYIEIFHFSSVYNTFAFRYATIWYNLYCILYHCGCLIYLQIAKSRSKARLHQRVKQLMRLLMDGAFACIIAPQAFGIASVFWGLILLDPEAAVPSKIRNDPYWIFTTNIQHTYIIVALLSDWLLYVRRYPKDRANAICVMLSFTIGFNVLQTCRGVIYNDWTYPIFQRSSAWVCILLFILGNSFVVALYGFCELINHSFHRLYRLLPDTSITFRSKQL